MVFLTDSVSEIYGQLLYVLQGSSVSFGKSSNGHMLIATLTHPADILNIHCCLQQNRDKIGTCLNSIIIRVIKKKNRPLQQLFKAFVVFYTSTATCFGLHWPSSGGTHNIIYKRSYYSYNGSVVCCTNCVCARYLTNAVTAYLNVITRYLLAHAITSFFIPLYCILLRVSQNMGKRTTTLRNSLYVY
jgi:hypothetical protein